MSLKELIAQKYDEEFKSLEEAVREKEKSLEAVKGKLKQFSDLEGRYTYLVERNDGIKVLVHKKDNEILFFSSNGRDITPLFENRKGARRDLVEQAKMLYEKDFVLDCVVVDKGHEDFCFYVSDVLFLGEDVKHLPLTDRKRFIGKLSFSDDFKESPSVKVESISDLDGALSVFNKLEVSKLLFKRRNSKYVLKDSDDWISFEVGKNG
ncbi:MAG: hypothetical protein ABIB71_08450 [Candidatus Woesearchaeota archaeon]